MPIVIKEVIVRITVEKTAPQRSSVTDGQLVERVKRQVLAELSEGGETSKARRYKKDR